MKKKQKNSGKKRTTSKSKISAKAKLSARAGSKKSSTKRKRAIRRRPVRESEDVMGSQSVETVPLSAVRQKHALPRRRIRRWRWRLQAAFPRCRR